jgi:hypothetical protein
VENNDQKQGAPTNDNRGRPVKRLQLVDSKITGNGAAILTYQPANNGKSA